MNSGNVALNGLTLADNLGAYSFEGGTVIPLAYIDGTIRYYVDGVLQTTPTVTAGSSLLISGINVPANGNAILVYEARTTQFAPLGTDDTITNAAVISGNEITPITIDETITTEN